MIAAADTARHPQPDGAVFLPFYSDSQACVLWGVRLAKTDRYAPVLGGIPEWKDEEDGGSPFTFPHLTFSSPTVESFLYRVWLENRIWFALYWDGGRPLTDEEQAYVDAL